MSFKSVAEIIKRCAEENLNCYEIVLKEDMQERQATKDDSIAKMTAMYTAMKNSNADYEGNLKSSSGLVGGAGSQMSEHIAKNKSLSGPFVSEVIAKALKTGESNACMKRIVAAPTAGSCGVVPAIFLTYQEQYDIPDSKMVEGLYVTAGIGQVIAHRAFISGAEGGCQAEIGSASAMAAAGLTYLRGGDLSSITSAAAMALKNLLGLACDPVAGLVEVPCVKRNVVGAVNAVACADMALAGIRSAIPADEVIDAMREIGLMMPCAIRETAQGGLATTPTGIQVLNHLNHY